MLACWVDDLAIACESKDQASDLVKCLEKRGLKLTFEGDLTAFLGIKLEHDDENRAFTLTQPRLIQRIFEAAGMEDCHPNATPAPQQPLGSDPDGEPMNEPWSH